MKKIFALTLVVLIVISIDYTYTEFKKSPHLELNELNDAAIPIHLELNFTTELSLNKPVELIANVSSLINASNTTVNVDLPEGFVLLGGDLSWKGNLIENQSVQIKSTIKPVKTGEWKIEGFVKNIVTEDSWWIDSDIIYVSLGIESNSKASYNSLENIKQQNNTQISLSSNVPMTSDSNLATSITSSVSAPSSCPGTGNIKVYGYEYYDINGFIKPMRNAKLELYDSDLTKNNLLSSTTTQADGYFEFPIVSNNDGYLESGMDIFIKAFVEDSGVVKVTSDGSTVYNFVTDVQSNVVDGCVNHGVWQVDNKATNYKSYWIYDYILNASQFLANYPHISFESTVKWSPSESIDGTFYRNGEWIHLLKDDTIPDTVIHEYGHNVMYVEYGNWMPITGCPKPHLFEMKSAVNCAWTEGWANFLPLAVQNDPIYNWKSGSQTNVETRAGGTYQSGEDVEGNVAGALWDFYDSNPDGYDIFYGGFTTIWDVLNNANNNNFAEFWSTWKSKSNNIPNIPKAKAAIFQNTIDYNNLPYIPNIPSPYNGATNQPISLTLTWSGGDPDVEDTVTYTTYFGTNSNPTTQKCSSTSLSCPVSGLSYSTPYFWKVIASDGLETSIGPVSDWSFTTQAQPNRPPNLPTSLIQYKSDGVTVIPLGGATSESTIVAKGGVSDPDSNNVQLELEIRPVGTSFSNSPTCSSTLISSGSTASATCSGLVSSQYHWQARIKDSYGASGSWLSGGGGNPESNADFIVDTTAPAPPTFNPTSSLWSPSDIGVTVTYSDISGISYTRHCWTPGSTCEPGTVDSNTFANGAVISQTSDGDWTLCTRAKNGAGSWSAYSCSGKYQKDTTTPSSPSSIIWDDGSQSPDTTIVANWGDVTDTSLIIDYHLQVDEDSTDFTSGMIFNGFIGSSASTKTLTSSDGVRIGHTYYYRVAAKNGAGLIGSFSTLSAGVAVQSSTNTYTVTVTTSGLPSSVSTNVYAGGVNQGSIPGGGTNTLTFDVGTTNSISVDSPISGSAGVRYVVTNSPQSVSGAAALTFNYKTQYYLTVITEPSAITSISGSNWYDYGTTQNTGTAPGTVGSYTFSTWKVDSYPVSGNPISVFIDAPYTATAVYSSSTPTTHTVCSSGCDHISIQVAIDAANPGDTIEVRSGIYPENIAIYKTLTLIGEDNTNTIIDGNDNGNVIYVNANNVQISGFKVIKGYTGIYLSYSGNNTLRGNNASNNNIGITLSFSTNNTLSENTAISNNGKGIYLDYSSNNTLIGNNASNNYFSIYIDYSSNNTLTGNNALNNDIGIFLDGSNNNKIYNNILNNTNNYYLHNSINIWNTTNQTGPNIIGGLYLGGNYWAYPNGTGLSQQCEDGTGDGICDSSYSLDSNNIDNLPLSYKVPGSGFSTAIDLSGSTSGSVEQGSYIYYSIQVNSGQTATVTLTPSSSDQDLMVYDTAQTLIGGSYNGGTTPDIYSFTASNSGKYFAAVNGYNAGSYTISVNIEGGKLTGTISGTVRRS